MAYNDDHIALAAEYALGTLDADERAQAEILMAIDAEFSELVRAWEYRLGALNQMVGLVEPRPIVWENVKAAIGNSAEPRAPLMLPEAPSPETPAFEGAAPVADDRNLVQLSGRMRRWRGAALAASALAAAVVALLAVQVYQPELLPGALRPMPRVQMVERPFAPPPAPPARSVQSAQFVALLQRDGGLPAFILTLDAATKSFTVRRVGADAEPGKSFELWLISDQLPQPRSLGVIGGSDFTARPVLSGYDANTINTATYAVTVEQAGGSPDGKPHSAPVFTGKLIETVPAVR